MESTKLLTTKQIETEKEQKKGSRISWLNLFDIDYWIVWYQIIKLYTKQIELNLKGDKMSLMNEL